jgi:cellobiose-specific phosphotransferase system component IIA
MNEIMDTQLMHARDQIMFFNLLLACIARLINCYNMVIVLWHIID